MPLDQPATPQALRLLASAGLLDASAIERALELTGGRPTASSWTDYA